VTTLPPTVASSTTAVPTSAPAPSAWVRQDLGEEPGDSEAVAATNDATTVLVAGFEAGEARAWVSGRRGEFSSAEIEGTDDETLWIHDVVAFDTGFVAVGNGYPSFVPRLWRSADGSAWKLVPTTGLSEPADIQRLVPTPAGLVAIGARRVGDEADEAAGGEMFAPSIWASPDGVSWSERASPVSGDGAHLVDVVALDSELVAITLTNGALQAWRSTDDAATWSEGRVQGANQSMSITSLATDGRVVLGLGSLGQNPIQGSPAVLRSDDGGRSFTVSPLDNRIQGALGSLGAETTFANGAWWAATNRYIDPFSDPDACYRDLDSCRDGAKAVLLTSLDGVTWSELDTSSMIGPYGQFSSVVDTPGGPLVIGRDEHLTTWRWPDAAAPPSLPAHVAPPPLDTPLVNWGGTIEPGLTYRYALGIHCGMDVLGELNGTYWYRVDSDAPAPETGAGDQPPPHWPVAEQSIFGYVTLVDADTIEYTIGDGEVIATYEPSDVEPPGCA
jgi:hypothetical protein